MTTETTPTPDEAPANPMREKLKSVLAVEDKGRSPSSRGARLALLILVPIAILQFAWSRQDLGLVLDHLTNDDTFLYLQVVRNIADHGQCSFDGIHVTTGIQPLWTALLVPVAAIFRDDVAFLRAVLALTVLLNLAAGYLLARTASALAKAPSAGVLTALLWTAYQMRMRPAMLGMESGLIAVSFAGLLAFVVMRPPPLKIGWRWRVSLAALAAVTFLSRVDASVLLVAIGVFVLVALVRDGRNWLETTREAAILAGLTLAFVLPYLGFNLAMAGRLMPVSGDVKRNYAKQDVPESGLASADGARHVIDRVVGNVNANFHRLVPVGQLVDVRLTRFGLGIVVVLLLVGCLSLRGPPRAVALTLVLGGIAHVVTFAAILGRFSPSTWYYVPEYATAALLGGVAAALIGAHRPRVRVVLTTTVALLVGFQIYWATARTFPHPNETGLFRMRWEFARHLDATLPSDARIGSWNAGQLGYFSNRTVVNLDGLVNDGAFAEFLASGGDIKEYLAREKITYLADYNERDLSVEPTRQWDPEISFRGLWPLAELEVLHRHGRFYLIRVPTP